MKYDVIIVGAGPGGIFAAYELVQLNKELSVAVFEAGHALNERKCPIDGDKIKTCINCKSCSIMSGFGGAGAFSDGKYNITNDFGDPKLQQPFFCRPFCRFPPFSLKAPRHRLLSS